MDDPNYYHDLVKLANDKSPDPLWAHSVGLLRIVVIFSLAMAWLAISLPLHAPRWINYAVLALMLASVAVNTAWSIYHSLFGHKVER